MKNGRRDYKAEANWEKKKKPSRASDRAQRMRARRKLEKEGAVKKNDGKQIDHRRTIKAGGTNKRSNLKVTSARANGKREAQRKARAAGKKKG